MNDKIDQMVSNIKELQAQKDITRRSLDDIKDALYNEEFELLKYMKEIRATKGMCSDGTTVTVHTTNKRDYDVEVLMNLKEMVTPEQWNEIHKTKDSFNWTKLNKLSKYGGKLADIIAEATINNVKNSISIKEG